VFDDLQIAGPLRVVPPHRRGIGLVAQEGALFPHLSVAGNVGYGLPRKERGGPRVAEVLAMTGLGMLAERHPHELSGGQQQRAALARALAPRPDVVLLDEPFNALDLDLRRNLSEEVTAMLRRDGATAILVTHDPEEAFASADLIAVMQDGLIAQCADPATIYLDPASIAIARMTGEALLLDGRIEGRTAITELGPLPVRNAGPAESPVTAFLRPEQVVIVEDGGGSPAVVVDSSFRGSATIVTLKAGKATIRIPRPGHFHAQKGDTVALRVTGSAIAFAGK
jgi:iron(III) transport system ATP-binding protein